MINSYLVVISLLLIAGLSGYNEAIENISLLITIALALISFLAMFMKNEKLSSVNKTHKSVNKTHKYALRIIWFLSILFYTAYGLWIQCIAMILSVIFIKNSGSLYKPEYDKTEKI
jgi:hypothetical protein